MLIKRGRFFGAIRQIVVSFLIGLDRSRFKEGNFFVEHAGVGDARNVTTGHVGQPEKVIGKMSPHTAARRWMPPMLDIAFAELVCGGADQMLAGECRFGMDQGHDILQLVAESISSARLIKTSPAPDTAAQGLI